MYQHPIPQNVTSYQFRLVGDLTLKQFLEFLIGVGLAVLFYVSNLYSPLKAVLMGASVVFGIALAFIPIEERPLDQWVIAFFRAIYRPTQFVWHKQPLMPEYFHYQAVASTQATLETSDATTQRKQAGLSSFMQTLPTDDFYNSLDTTQSEQLRYISGLFSTTPPPMTKATAPSAYNSPLTSTPPAIHVAPSPALPTPSEAPNQTLPPVTLTAELTANPTIPLPSPPAAINTLSGVVLTSLQQPLENAMIEIIDQQQTPIRATKTNKLGQFFSSTPLKNGVYDLRVEAPGFTTSIMTFKAEGEIIPPVQIELKVAQP